jgi:hypothetical protein
MSQIRLTDVLVVPTPLAGVHTIFSKAAGIYVKDSTGAEILLGAGGAGVQNNFVAVVPPAVTDNVAAGYSTGSVWIVPSTTTPDGAWVALGEDAGDMIWARMDVKHNLAAGAAPVVGDDSGDGYSAGSIWLWPANNAWICVSAALGAATWLPLIPDYAGAGVVLDSDFAGGHIGVMTRTGAGAYAIARTVLTSGGPPGVGEDSTIGFAVGSVYVFGADIYMCADPAPGAAVWKLIG